MMVKSTSISGSAIPDFMSLSQNGLLKFATAQKLHVGEHKISLSALLLSQTRQNSSAELTLIVNYQPFDLNLPSQRPPEFKFESQKVLIGDSYSYQLPIIKNYQGFEMNMKVGLGQAEGFLYFDEKTQTLKINENSLDNSKAGVYAVTVTVWLNDENNPS